MTPEFELLTHQIVSAVVNGVYQGALVAVVVWLAFKLFRKMSATTRHAIGFVALLLVAALPVFHFVNSLSVVDWSEETTSNTALLDGTFENIGPEFLPVVDPIFEERTTPTYVSEIEQPVILESLESEFEKPEPDTVLPKLLVEQSSEKRASVGEMLGRLTPMALVGELPTNVALIIVVGIALLGLWRLGRLGAQFLCLSRLKRNNAQIDESTLQAFDRIIHESGCRRSVRLMSSDRINTPIAVGYFDAVVLLPADLVTGMEPAELDAILRHEIAHINRRDDWFNLVQQFVAAACGFNPAIAWLSGRLTMDRELACDDHALSRSDSPEDYAFTLTEFAGRSRESRWIAAPAAWNSKNQLKERITMILDPNRNTSLKLGKASAGVLAIVATGIAGIAFLTAPRLVLAQSALDPVETLPHATGLELVSPESSDNSVATSYELSEPVDPTETSSSDIFATRTTGSTKPARANSFTYATVGQSPESFPPSVDPNPTLEAPSKTSSRNSGRTRYGYSVNVNPGIASSRVVSSFTATPEVNRVETPRVVVVQNSSALNPAPVVPSKPRAPRQPQDPFAAAQPLQPVQPLQPHVVHVQTNTDFDGHRNRALEQRLEKLERKLAEMSAPKPSFGGGGGGAGFESVESSAGFFGGGDEAMAEEWPNPFGEEQQIAIEVAVEQANQQMVEAMKQVELANKQIDRRVRKEVSREMEIEARRSALNSQKRSLEKQMRRLDEQMEALHHEVHSLEEQLDEIEAPKGGFDAFGDPDAKASF